MAGPNSFHPSIFLSYLTRGTGAYLQWSRQGHPGHLAHCRTTHREVVVHNFKRHYTVKLKMVFEHFYEKFSIQANFKEHVIWYLLSKKIWKSYPFPFEKELGRDNLRPWQWNADSNCFFPQRFIGHFGPRQFGVLAWTFSFLCIKAANASKLSTDPYWFTGVAWLCDRVCTMWWFVIRIFGKIFPGENPRTLLGQWNQRQTLADIWYCAPCPSNRSLYSDFNLNRCQAPRLNTSQNC